MFWRLRIILRRSAVAICLLGASCASTDTGKSKSLEDFYQQGTRNAEEEIRRNHLYLLVIGLSAPPHRDPETGLDYRATGCSAYPELDAHIKGHNERMKMFVRKNNSAAST